MVDLVFQRSIDRFPKAIHCFPILADQQSNDELAGGLLLVEVKTQIAGFVEEDDHG
jgi:hypothetical protein